MKDWLFSAAMGAVTMVLCLLVTTTSNAWGIAEIPGKAWIMAALAGLLIFTMGMGHLGLSDAIHGD
jgi:hypothetical protein